MDAPARGASEGPARGQRGDSEEREKKDMILFQTRAKELLRSLLLLRLLFAVAASDELSLSFSPSLSPPLTEAVINAPAAVE